jgi:lysophospholipase L1-like esterase
MQTGNEDHQMSAGFAAGAWRLLTVCAPGLVVILGAVGTFLASAGRSDIGFGKKKLLIYCAIGAGFAVAGALLHVKATADERARRRTYWKTVVFLLVAIVVMPALTIFVADKAVGLVLARVPAGPLLVFPPHYRVSYRTPEFAFTAETNAVGIRDREIDLNNKNGLRVIALGDSFTYGWGVEGAESWPKVLERLLNDKKQPAEVLNLGCPGTSVDAYATIAERAIPLLKPDLVIVGVLQGDDLKQLDMGSTTDRLFKFNGVADDEPASEVLSRVLPNFMELRARLAAHRPRQISAEQIRAEWQGLAQSMLKRMDADEMARYQKADAKVRDMLVDGGLNPWDVYFAAKQPDYLDFTLHPDRADVSSAVDKMAACLVRIRAAAGAVDARVETIGVPASCYTCVKGLDSRRRVGYHLDDSALRSTAPDDTIRSACKQAGVGFHSCTANFRKVGAARELYFEYDGHFNPAGHALFAEQVAEFVPAPAE